MIRYKIGNILEENVEAIVNPVNCVGVMGRGLALQCKRKHPRNFKAYVDACEVGEVIPGKMFVFDRRVLVFPKYIINFPTKRHWRDKSIMADIEDGLVSLADDVMSLGIRSIAIPPLGCGLGGLDWFDVKEKIEDIFDDIHIGGNCNVNKVHVIVYEPIDD